MYPFPACDVGRSSQGTVRWPLGQGKCLQDGAEATDNLNNWFTFAGKVLSGPSEELNVHTTHLQGGTGGKSKTAEVLTVVQAGG